jgi:hypothetical protein
LAFFDFLSDLPDYGHVPAKVQRLNKRHPFLVSQFSADILDARVLDLGAHDGRWSYAIAAAGAAQVTAIEARASVAARLDAFPDTTLKSRITMRVSDVFAGLEEAVAAGERYDVVAVFGLLYHVMDHFRLLLLVHQLQPKLIIIDSDFIKQQGALIRLVREDTDNDLNAAPQTAGQKVAVKGVPSRAALDLMAQALGYGLTWSDWGALPPEQRAGVQDYYLTPDRVLRRGTCALRPL